MPGAVVPLASVQIASVLGEITDTVTSAIGDYGLYAVFLLMLVDAVLPAASEVVMVYGGAVASGALAGQEVQLFGWTFAEGWPAYVAIALAGTIGYTLGSVLGWGIGLYGGRPYLERHGRWLHLDEAKLDRAERWFERWEDWAVFLGRLTPVVRSFVSIPAGVMEVPLVRYTLLTLLGSAIWCFAFAGAGFAAGSSWEDFHHAFRYFDYLVVAALGAAVLWVVVRRLRRRRLAQESSSR
jgi:membrane protein DedA with SNARE-associated domain